MPSFEAVRGQEVCAVGHVRTKRSGAYTGDATIAMHKIYSRAQSLCCGVAIVSHDGSSLMHTSSLLPPPRPFPPPPPHHPGSSQPLLQFLLL